MKKTIKTLFQKINWIYAVLIFLVFFLIFAAIMYVKGEIQIAEFKQNFVVSIFIAVSIFCIYRKFAKLDEAIEESEKAEKELEEVLTKKGDIIFLPNQKTPKASPYESDFVIKVKTESKITSADDIKDAIDNMKITRPKPEKPNSFDKPKPIVNDGESKAEKEGNVIIGSDGKPIVKPNYKMIASEWVRNNLELLNKICNDAYAISGGSGAYSATIPATFLPEEKASWIIIGKTLVAEDDISSFKILKDGLQVTVS